MESDIISKIKDWLVVLIPFLFICSGIYHLTYWNTFNMNGLEITSIENIIKTMIKPFITNSSIFSFLIIGIIVNYFSNVKAKEIPKSEAAEKKLDSLNSIQDVENSLRNTKNSFKLMKKKFLKEERNLKVTTTFSLIFWLILMTYSIFNNNWIMLPYFFGFFGFSIFSFFSKSYNKYSFILTFIICLILATSYTSAKIESENVKNNKSFKYITNNEFGKIVIYKCLGETDENIIVSDLKNSKVVYFAKSEDSVTFRFFNLKNMMSIL